MDDLNATPMPTLQNMMEKYTAMNPSEITNIYMNIFTGKAPGRAPTSQKATPETKKWWSEDDPPKQIEFPLLIFNCVCIYVKISDNADYYNKNS